MALSSGEPHAPTKAAWKFRCSLNHATLMSWNTVALMVGSIVSSYCRTSVTAHLRYAISDLGGAFPLGQSRLYLYLLSDMRTEKFECAP